MAEFLPENFDGPLPEDKSPLARRAERQRELEEFWHLTFLYDRLSDEEKADLGRLDRIALGYRLCRELCRVKGLIAEEEPLCTSVGLVPSPWTNAVGSSPTELDIEPGQIICPKTYLSEPSPIYPPESDEDKGFLPFYAAVNEVADRLQLGFQKAFGAGLLLRPEHRALWPSPYQILTYENALMRELMVKEMEEGQVGVRRHLEEKGYLTWEIESAVRASRKTMVRNVLLTAEEAKAILLLRLEHLIQQCRKAERTSDVRAELSAIKLMAWVCGLHKFEPDDSMKEILDVVKEVESKEKKGGA